MWSSPVLSLMSFSFLGVGVTLGFELRATCLSDTPKPSFFLSLCGNGTQGFEHARQAFHHWSTSGLKIFLLFQNLI
jgi:hypothetical protein